MVNGKPVVSGLGEILWDLLPGGRQLGGAPANFAYHAHALGARAFPISRIGQDALGTELLDRLRSLGLPTEGIQLDTDAPTGTVSVELLDDGGHQFTIHENVSWDRIEAESGAQALASTADAICFGSLAQRTSASRIAVQAIVAATPPEALRIFDINLRQNFYSPEVIVQSLRIANVLKINDEELPIVADILALHGSPIEQLSQISDSFHLQLAALTLGKAGSILLADSRVSEMAGAPVEVVDTVGAGDAFTAAMALGWLAGWDLNEINRHANQVASYVCTQSGATPPLPPELTSPFSAD